MKLASNNLWTSLAMALSLSCANTLFLHRMVERIGRHWVDEPWYLDWSQACPHGSRQRCLGCPLGKGLAYFGLKGWLVCRCKWSDLYICCLGRWFLIPLSILHSLIAPQCSWWSFVSSREMVSNPFIDFIFTRRSLMFMVVICFVHLQHDYIAFPGCYLILSGLSYPTICRELQ